MRPCLSSKVDGPFIYLAYLSKWLPVGRPNFFGGTVCVEETLLIWRKRRAELHSETLSGASGVSDRPTGVLVRDHLLRALARPLLDWPGRRFLLVELPDAHRRQPPPQRYRSFRWVVCSAIQPTNWNCIRALYLMQLCWKKSFLTLSVTAYMVVVCIQWSSISFTSDAYDQPIQLKLVK